jgi:hypothetical protein
MGDNAFGLELLSAFRGRLSPYGQSLYEPQTSFPPISTGEALVETALERDRHSRRGGFERLRTVLAGIGCVAAVTVYIGFLPISRCTAAASVGLPAFPALAVAGTPAVVNAAASTFAAGSNLSAWAGSTSTLTPTISISPRLGSFGLIMTIGLPFQSSSTHFPSLSAYSSSPTSVKASGSDASVARSKFCPWNGKIAQAMLIWSCRVTDRDDVIFANSNFSERLSFCNCAVKLRKLSNSPSEMVWRASDDTQIAASENSSRITPTATTHTNMRFQFQPRWAGIHLTSFFSANSSATSPTPITSANATSESSARDSQDSATNFELGIKGDPERKLQIELAILSMFGAGLLFMGWLAWGVFCLITGRFKRG